jgi:hypothetical protein
MLLRCRGGRRRAVQVVARRGTALLIDLGDDRGQVYDEQTGRLFTPQNIHSILQRGYWINDDSPLPAAAMLGTVVIDAKHLPGRHNQLDHGRGHRSESGWAPAMTRAEADQWAKDSALADVTPVHVTRELSRRTIETDGFDLRRQQWGRAWGDGVYGALDRSAIEMYSHGNDPAYRVLPLKINARKALTVEVNPDDVVRLGHETVRFNILRDHGLADAYRKTVNDFAAANDLTQRNVTRQVAREFRAAGKTPADAASSAGTERRAELYAEAADRGEWHPRPEQSAFTETLRQAGYDALVIRAGDDAQFGDFGRAKLGYAQVVTFDPERVTVVTDEVRSAAP